MKQTEIIDYQTREDIELKFRRKNPFRTTLIWRADGRLEWMCRHGVGHTVFAPEVKQTNGVVFRDWVHGCDGCCRGIKVVRG